MMNGAIMRSCTDEWFEWVKKWINSISEAGIGHMLGVSQAKTNKQETPMRAAFCLREDVTWHFKKGDGTCRTSRDCSLHMNELMMLMIWSAFFRASIIIIQITFKNTLIAMNFLLFFYMLDLSLTLGKSNPIATIVSKARHPYIPLKFES